MNKLPAVPAHLRRTLYCQDCGQEKIAEVRNGRLLITDRRHGRTHFAVYHLSDLELLLGDEAGAHEAGAGGQSTAP